MLVVKLLGGFGNQLFQYAVGRALSINRQEDLLLDLTFLTADPKGTYTKRNFELDQIKIVAKIASDEEVEKFSSKTIFRKVLNRAKLSSHVVFNEFQPNYIAGIERLPKNVLLNGYWQSEKYFSGIRTQLLNEIVPSYEFTDKGKSYLFEIEKSHSVSIHVRRGDYVNMASAVDFHGTCDISYYKNAINKLKEKHSDLKFFIFSDDLSWCKKEFNFLDSAVFIDEEKDKRSSQDLFLMSHCKHNIIANSSYSWWGAWLNQYDNKIVIAPKKWFLGKMDTSDLCPENWIRF